MKAMHKPDAGVGSSRVVPTKEARQKLPGWKAVLVTDETYARLQEIRQSRQDPPIHLHYLSEAAVLIALESGSGPILKRAGTEVKRRLPS
jgi:hypothetical protein